MRDLKKLRSVRKHILSVMDEIDRTLYPDIYGKLADAIVYLDRQINVLEHNKPINKFKRILKGEKV